MWSTENSRFCERHIEKQPKISQNGLFSAAFWSKWQDSNLRSHRPERCAIPPSLHLEMVKLLDFFVSGQTCGQTEELMIFRHSGEPKKSVFSRVFGSSRKFYAENGDWDPNHAHYQTVPHPDILFIIWFLIRTCGLVARSHFRRKFAHIPNGATPRNRPNDYITRGFVCQVFFGILFFTWRIGQVMVWLKGRARACARL